MPQAKGKKKSKRLRRQLGMLGGDGPAETAVQRNSGSTPVKKQRPPAGPIMRRGWQPPFWVNAGFGVVLLIMGVIFFATIGGKTGGNTKFVMLLAYCALGGFYLARAFRQYRAKRGT